MSDVVWVVGQARQPDGWKGLWELRGVYSSELLAVEACDDRECFVGAVRLDATAPKGTTEWPGAYYPRTEVKHE